MDDEGGAPDTLQDGSKPAPRKRTQKAVGDNFASRGEASADGEDPYSTRSNHLCE